MRLCRGRQPRALAATQLALLPLAAFAVHQLRYLFAFGGHAGAVLQATGHAYLTSVAPWIIAFAALVVGGFLRSLGRALAGHATLSRYTISLAGMWLACTASLLAIYIAQELLEGIFLAGHPSGWVGVFGYGGGWAIPAAAIVGLVLASLLHGALWVLREVARLGAARAARPRPRLVVRSRPADALLALLPPLVGGWSDRGPPLARR